MDSSLRWSRAVCWRDSYHRNVNCEQDLKTKSASSNVSFVQDAEYVKIASEAWTEAVALAELQDGWKEEKIEKTTVSLFVYVFLLRKCNFFRATLSKAERRIMERRFTDVGQRSTFLQSF